MPICAQDYVVVDTRGLVVDGPYRDFFKADAEAKKRGGFVQFVMHEAAQAQDFDTKEDAIVSAKRQGRSEKDVFEARGRWHVAREVVPVAHEARDAGAFATVERDPKVVDQARALGEVSDARKVYDILHEQYAKESQEVYLVLPVDLRGQLLAPPVEVARGQRDRVTIDVSDVLRPVIATNAQGFICTHNHPSGHATPSGADKALTKHIKGSAKVALPEVTMLDHVVVGRREFYSFTEGRLYKVK